MRLKTISKFVLGAVCGSLLTISIYATADSGSSTEVNTDASVANTIPIDEINNFARIYAITKNYYVESVNDSKLMKGAVTGMLSNLDPHSDYLDTEDFKQLSEMTSGSFAGLGIEVSRDKGDSGVKVVAPIYGTPAYNAGIKSGDFIVRIDDTPVSGMSLDDAIKRMRGKAGTKVRISIARANELKPIEFTIIRAKIEIHSVKSAMLAPDYGYIRITNFQADTSNELAKALNKLAADQSLKGLVIDLRDDPGGLLQSAVGVSAAFLPKDSLVVYTDGRIASSKQKYYVKPDDYDIDGTQEKSLNSIPDKFKTLPIVVLVNQGTASASEIVSGALQDYKRAKIIGVKTFGKGSVQTVIPLSKDTAVKLTTALYYTPKGRSIQAQGISPDIIVQSEYSDLLDSWDVSEASLDKHLSHPDNATKTNVESVPVIRPPKQIATKAELKAKLDTKMKQVPKVVDQTQAQVDLKEDFQLQWALNILEGKPLPADSLPKTTKAN
ncbi:MAG: S41 family peptidase [Neisseriales bacterium]|jgi:carboxyl-terminal processing protease|nr:MAG: S41 family peptidase [Neisseriales bacterium]